MAATRTPAFVLGASGPIQWRQLTTSQIRAARDEAGQAGDADLVRLATAALRRRGLD